MEWHVPSKLGVVAKPNSKATRFFHRMRVALLLLIPLAGCLDAATGNLANVPAPTASVAGEVAMRRVFSTGLTAPTGDKKSGGSRTFARGRVELKLRRDSTLEYHLNVYNPGADNFTAAHVYRVGRPGPPVVTLFTGASLRDKYIQVRGTGVLIDPVGKPVLEELRANPGGFYVSLRTTREPQGALRGTIQ
jgi:hypothetical protein